MTGLAILLAVAGPASAAQPWGFEQVTPPVKGSGALSYVDTFQSSPDGESFLYTTNSPFTAPPSESSPAYTRYLGYRGGEGWTNVSLDPPYEAGVGAGAAFDILGVIATSHDLKWALVASTTAMTPGATEGGGNLYIRNTRTRELQLVATSHSRYLSSVMNGNMGELSVRYVGPEGGVIFTTSLSLTPDAPEVSTTEASPIYAWSPSGGLEAVSVLPASEGGEVVGANGAGNGSETGVRNSIAYEGGLDHIYFQSYRNNQPGGLYVRSDGVTEPVSFSRLPGATGEVMIAEPDAVSNDGRYLLFHTQSRLTEDSPAFPAGGGYLYRYDVTDGSLTYIGLDGNYTTAQVIQMTQDGKTIAFQSEAAQAPGAIEGQANVYVWQEGGPGLKLAATLDTGSSGSNQATSSRVLSENGRYLAFTDDSVSLAQQFGQPNVSASCPTFTEEPGPCDEVYVFDDEATSGALQCASCSPDGTPTIGDSGDALNKNQGYMRANAHQMQMVANDGTVFFTTFNGLLPADKNEAEDAYAYHEGNLRLISRATPGTSARFLDASPDGKTVFISTNDPIAPTDIDRSVDVYMTREGAGFPYAPPVVTPPCGNAETCHGGTPPVPGQTSAGTASFQGRGNQTPPVVTLTVARPKPFAGPKGSLRVKVTGKGKLGIFGAGLVAASKKVPKAGTYGVQVKLTAAAGKALRRSGKVRKRAKVTFTPSGGKASVKTVQLTFKSSAKKKGH